MTKGDLGLAVVVLGIVAIYAAYAYAFPLRRERRKTQRYQLFAVRHRIVMLVADGKVDEEDKIFQFLYESVNYLIPSAKRLSRWEILRSVTASPLAQLTDDEFRASLIEMMKHEDREVRRVTYDFFGILATKLAHIWSVKIAATLAGWGLNVCVNGLRALERRLTKRPSNHEEALCLYYSLKESREALAAA